jgi:hypothetical protein
VPPRRDRADADPPSPAGLARGRPSTASDGTDSVARTCRSPESTMRHVFALLAAFLFAAAVAAPAAAQCASISPSGCPTQTNPICGTQPQIGTQFVFRCPPTCFGTGLTQFVVLGTPSSPAITFTPPIMCGPNNCTLVCRPIVIVPAPGATLNIPNNPALIGFQLCIQCLCVNAAVPCFQITQGTMATIF